MVSAADSCCDCVSVLQECPAASPWWWPTSWRWRVAGGWSLWRRWGQPVRAPAPTWDSCGNWRSLKTQNWQKWVVTSESTDAKITPAKVQMGDIITLKYLIPVWVWETVVRKISSHLWSQLRTLLPLCLLFLLSSSPSLLLLSLLLPPTLSSSTLPPTPLPHSSHLPLSSLSERGFMDVALH